MSILRDELAYWINERYAVKLRKAAGGPPPWSTDKAFQTVRFCNVHREDDTVTQWIRKHWNRSDSPLWHFVLARLINWPETLAEIQQFQNQDNILSILKQRRARGQKVFTSAYTISTCGKRMDKLDYVMGVVTHSGAVPVSYARLSTTYEAICSVDGLGSFLSAQIIADMKNTPGHALCGAPDWWTFSAPGPGSLRGLGWYFGGNSTTTVPARMYNGAMLACMDEVTPLLHDGIPRIGAQDFQNCLCEFSKWCKVIFDDGHVRNRYVAHH